MAGEGSMPEDPDLRQELQGLRRSLEGIAAAVTGLAERQATMEALLLRMLEALLPEEEAEGGREAEESDLSNLFQRMLQALDQQGKTLKNLLELQSGVGKTIEEAVIRGVARAREELTKTQTAKRTGAG
jgi:hypothetical protein